MRVDMQDKHRHTQTARRTLAETKLALLPMSVHGCGTLLVAQTGPLHVERENTEGRHHGLLRRGRSGSTAIQGAIGAKGLVLLLDLRQANVLTTRLCAT